MDERDGVRKVAFGKFHYGPILAQTQKGANLLLDLAHVSGVSHSEF